MIEEWLEKAMDLGLITAHGLNSAGLHCVRWVDGERTTLYWGMYCHPIKEIRELHQVKTQEAVCSY